MHFEGYGYEMLHIQCLNQQMHHRVKKTVLEIVSKYIEFRRIVHHFKCIYVEVYSTAP
jgi:hypothetical protein